MDIPFKNVSGLAACHHPLKSSANIHPTKMEKHFFKNTPLGLQVLERGLISTPPLSACFGGQDRRLFYVWISPWWSSENLTFPIEVATICAYSLVREKILKVLNNQNTINSILCGNTLRGQHIIGIHYPYHRNIHFYFGILRNCWSEPVVQMGRAMINPRSKTWSHYGVFLKIKRLSILAPGLWKNTNIVKRE